MNLLPSPDPELARHLNEAQTLWEQARRENTAPTEAPSLVEPGRALMDFGDLAALTNAVRQVLGARDAETTVEAHFAFEATHTRLMQAVAASQVLQVGGHALPAPDASVADKPIDAPGSARSGWRSAAGSAWPPRRLGAARPRLWRTFARNALLVASLMVAAMVGRASAYREVPFIPIGRMVEEYASRVKHHSESNDIVMADARSAEAIFTRSAGMRVILPRPETTGVKLLGVRQGEIEGTAMVESQYLDGANRFAFIQAWGPRHAIRFATEKRLGNRVYMLRDCGEYHVVAWRADDTVLAVVTPLDWEPALALAERLRTSTASQLTADEKA